MSGRAKRRKQRAEQQRVTVFAGENVVAASLGQQYAARRARELPPKIAGRHRWVATGCWVLSDFDAAAALDPDMPKLLDNENMMDLSVGCWDCEQPLGVIDVDSSCPAAAS